MAQKVLITGATGFVGSILTCHLLDRGYEVRCLVRPGTEAKNLGGLEVDQAPGRLEDEGSLEAALSGVDEVYHLAALVSFRRQDREAMFRINEGGSRTLARLARLAGVGRFLHVSSIAAVGHAVDRVPVDETCPYNFARFGIPYCDSKRAAELAVLEEVGKGLDAVVVNPASIIGPGDRRKAEGSLLEAVAYERIPFCPGGGVNFVDVRDVVSGCLAAMEKGRTGERYILAGANLTGPRMLAKIAGVIGKKPPRLVLPAFLTSLIASLANAWERIRPLEPPLTGAVLRLASLWLWYSTRKAEEELDYASCPIELAVKDAFDWMLDRDLIDPKKVKGLGRV